MGRSTAEDQTHCDKCQPGAKVARDLGIYLGQVYGYIKRGLVENHKVGGYPEGKGVEVEPEQVRAAWMQSKKKGPRDPSKPRASKAKRVRNEDGTLEPAAKARRLPAGTIVSYERGRAANGHEAGKPRYTVAQVLAANGRLTFLDEGDKRRHYDGTQIDNIIYGTERLSTMLAKGVARIEHPVPLLGMILLSFVMEGKMELAASLEKWMEKNDVPVIVPELIDLDEDDEPEPVRGKPILAEEGDDDADE